MKLQVENSVWHAFDYLSMENGKQSANKSKLKVSCQLSIPQSHTPSSPDPTYVIPQQQQNPTPTFLC